MGRCGGLVKVALLAVFYVIVAVFLCGVLIAGLTFAVWLLPSDGERHNDDPYPRCDYSYPVPPKGAC